MGKESASARVDASWEGRVWRVVLRGEWSLQSGVPAWVEPTGEGKPEWIRVDAAGLESWDSSLVLFLTAARAWAEKAEVGLDLSGEPGHVRNLAEQAWSARREAPRREAGGRRMMAVSVGMLTLLGNVSRGLATEASGAARFVGECTLAVGRVAREPRRFRFRDCMVEMQLCGAMALPIVGLVSFLVGVIMAYQAALQLRQFGADIFVANLVSLAVVREMGPMMAAVVVSGRTGAAFAAHIANMKAAEEVAALEVTGVSPVDFLVLPRLVALFVMMPLLTVYSNFIGVSGGVVVAWGLLDISPTAFLAQTQSILDFSDIASGLIKSVVFGLLIACAGCLRGLQAAPSAAGVGAAATSAVVTSILLIIVADAVFAVIFNLLGI